MLYTLTLTQRSAFFDTMSRIKTLIERILRRLTYKIPQPYPVRARSAMRIQLVAALGGHDDETSLVIASTDCVTHIVCLASFSLVLFMFRSLRVSS